jgi:hypothetical protein
MLNCREVTMLISASQERRLRLAERVSLKLHTMRCSGCRNFSFQVPFIRQVMRAYAAGKDAEAKK